MSKFNNREEAKKQFPQHWQQIANTPTRTGDLQAIWDYWNKYVVEEYDANEAREMLKLIAVLVNGDPHPDANAWLGRLAKDQALLKWMVLVRYRLEERQWDTVWRNWSASCNA